MDSKQRDWALPAAIPFEKLKSKDLEECLYWLVDAMGAKDLEWRSGGEGEGAADGGRDLAATFYLPGADGEGEVQHWWIECKGRNKTVEKQAVISAVNNAQASSGLDYVVIATNTQFSNPTLDWVREWQAKFPRPKVKLWDRAQLERYLSRHPDVVLRLFSGALSLEGRCHALEARFWNKLEYVPSSSLAEIWDKRSDLEFTVMGTFALIANEFANGDISARPWAAILNSKGLTHVLNLALMNVGYLILRSHKSGSDEEPILRALAYVVLVAIDSFGAGPTTELFGESIFQGRSEKYPEEIQKFLITPIVGGLVADLQDVCASDCVRISTCSNRSRYGDTDEIENYWSRLELRDVKAEPPDSRRLVIEKHDAPCVVGFEVNAEKSCPLFGMDIRPDSIAEIFKVIQHVAAYRKAATARAN